MKHEHIFRQNYNIFSNEFACVYVRACDRMYVRYDWMDERTDGRMYEWMF